MGRQLDSEGIEMQNDRGRTTTTPYERRTIGKAGGII